MQLARPWDFKRRAIYRPWCLSGGPARPAMDHITLHQRVVNRIIFAGGAGPPCRKILAVLRLRSDRCDSPAKAVQGEHHVCDFTIDAADAHRTYAGNRKPDAAITSGDLDEL